MYLCVFVCVFESLCVCLIVSQSPKYGMDGV